MQLLCCNRRFSTRSKAEDYTAKYTRPRDLLFEDPTAILFTDGSALPTPSLGSGEGKSLHPWTSARATIVTPSINQAYRIENRRWGSVGVRGP